MSVERPELERALHELVTCAAERSRRTRALQRLSLGWPTAGADALALFEAGCDEEDAFYWEQPQLEVAIAALGCTHAIECDGPTRFGDASRRSRTLFEQLSHRTCGAPRSDDTEGPILVGGFGFYEQAPGKASVWRAFGAGRLVLPERLFVRRGDASRCVVTGAIAPDEDPRDCERRLRACLHDTLDWVAGHRAVASPSNALAGSVSLACESDATDLGPEYRVRSDRTHGRYCAQVAAALDDIDAGKLQKVVLARSLRVRHDGVFMVVHFLDDLRRLYPGCAIVAFRRAGQCFVSATPERLVSLRGGRVRTAAVAGSAPRGRSPDEEERYGRHLMESEKERNEHELVKRAIANALIDDCGVLEGPEAPRLLRLEGIQHLETPLDAELREERRSGVGLLELVARLHPTPAVSGTPNAIALEWLQRNEHLERGWYAGPVGYLDARAEGEFRVALRSGLIEAGEALLFAGAGIVPGSLPERELAETRLKLRALLAPLTEI